jgi:serine/threonine-protein kinase
MSLPKTIGRYEVLEEIGRGSMGVVYKARDPRIGRVVALKCVSFSFPLGPGEEEDFLRRFYHEAQIAGRLSHGNIVTIYDVGEKSAEGAAFIAMEYVTGSNLQELLAGGGRLPLTQIADLASQAADALDYAHANGVVHRDIKPGNLVLTESGQLKILDFGIARVTAADASRPGRFLGTPNYMAPEQVTGSPVDGRADQFALGVTLFHLMTGERPFAGESITAISYQVVNVTPPPPSRLNPTLPAAVDPILARALAKAPADRYPRCGDLAADLKSAVAAWREAANQAAPRTLESSAPPLTAIGDPARAGAAARRPGSWLSFAGPESLIGWALFLVPLAVLAAAPYLLRGADRLQPPAPAGLLGPSLSSPAPAEAEQAIARENAATLVLSLQHRLRSGEITARLDGVSVLEEPVRGAGGRSRWTREIRVTPGMHRFEVRLRGDGGEVDDIEGMDLDLSPRERATIILSVHPLTHRLKMRSERPVAGSGR